MDRFKFVLYLILLGIFIEFMCGFIKGFIGG